MAEGTAILELDRIDDSEIQSLCNMPLSEVKKNNGRFVYSLIEMAHRSDTMSELLVDRYMCTNNTCPCANYKLRGSSITTKELFIEQFNKLDKEEILASKRTIDQSQSNSKIPIFFGNNGKGFDSFHSCYEDWWGRAFVDKNIDLSAVFRINTDQYI